MINLSYILTIKSLQTGKLGEHVVTIYPGQGHDGGDLIKGLTSAIIPALRQLIDIDETPNPDPYQERQNDKAKACAQSN